MAIHKKVPDKNAEAPGAIKDITLPAFSYQNDRLADLIVAAWANGPFSHGGVTVQRLGDALVKDRDAQGRPTPTARATAKAAVNFFANMDLKSVVVITEEEHDNEYTMQDPDEVRLCVAEGHPTHRRRERTTLRTGSSRNGQIADGLYAKRNLAVR